MAYVYQYTRRNGTLDPIWRIEYREWTGRKRKVKGFRSKRQTEELATELEARQTLIRKGQIEPVRSPEGRVPFVEAAREYLAWGDAQGGRHGHPWGAGHSRVRRAQLQWWSEKLRAGRLVEMKGSLPRVEALLRGLQAEGKSGKTVSHYAGTLVAFLAWCVEREYLREHPLAKLKAFATAPKSRRRAITGDELARLMDSCPPERSLLYEVAICTGLRANELRSLTLDHLDVERGGVHLEAAWTKNRQPGFQPLPPDLIQRLLAFHAEGGVEQKFKRAYVRRDAKAMPERRLLYILSNPVKAFDQDLRAAGIPKATREGKLDFHALRVACATFLIEQGATVREAQTLLRHSSPTLTMNIYAQTREGRLSEVVGRVGQAIQARQLPPPGQQVSDGIRLGSCSPDVLEAQPVAAIERHEDGSQGGGAAPGTLQNIDSVRLGQAEAAGRQKSAPSVPHPASEGAADHCNDTSYMVEAAGVEPAFYFRKLFFINAIRFDL